MNYTEDFELFWRAYPPRFNEERQLYRRADKPGAFAEWQKLTAEEKIAALNAVQREKSSKWTPDARKWLHHKRWEDIIAPLREFDRPLPKEIQAMIAKMLPPEKILNPPVKGIDIPLSDYELNKRRNKAKDQLGIE